MSGPDEIGDIPHLEAVARRVRAEVLEAVVRAGGGHVGGPLSVADILVALYFSVMNVRPDDPTWVDRDRLVLSKGHASAALYATLALRGYFPLTELATFDVIGSRLQGHPDMTKLPAIDMSTGSLGCGFSAAVGLALGAKLRQMAHTTFVILGDGECQEGIVWEGAHIAAQYGLSRLVGIVDLNGLQQYGWPDAKPNARQRPFGAGDLARRWRAWGWRVHIVDGHDFSALIRVFSEARGSHNKPTIVIAKTVKGRGVPFMEDRYEWHARVPTEDELQNALCALGR
jgi:transketolase